MKNLFTIYKEIADNFQPIFHAQANSYFDALITSIGLVKSYRIFAL